MLLSRVPGRYGLLFLLATCASHAAGSKLIIEKAWARPTPPGVDVGAVYLIIKNQGALTESLLRLSTPIADSAQMHETRAQGGLMSMRALPFLELRAGAEVAAAPGALHIMLIGLRKPLLSGDTFTLTLVFASGEKSVDVRVRGDP